ncbi:MAG: hypothetical protein ACOC22_00950, partial [bacterium]
LFNTTTQITINQNTKNDERFDAHEAYSKLYNKINYLVGLKYAINEANREIQAKIYMLSEYKGLISFLNELDVKEGTQSVGYSDVVREYGVHINEAERDNLINKYQTKVDAIQEEIDVFNHTTEIPWGEASDEELEE